jgi:hypothetical protein
LAGAIPRYVANALGNILSLMAICYWANLPEKMAALSRAQFG